MTTRKASVISYLKKELKKLRKEQKQFEKEASLENFNPTTQELNAAEMSWIRGYRAEKFEDIIEYLERKV